MKKRTWILISMTFLIISCKTNNSNKYIHTPIVLRQPEKYGDYDAYLSLIINKADLNAIDEEIKLSDWGSTPLTMAVHYGYIDIVEELLLKGADIDGYDEQGITPLLTGIEDCDFDMVELLVNKGADVNKRRNEFDDDFTGDDSEEKFYGEEAPIHTAIGTGGKPFVEILIKNGADVNSKYGYDESALKDARLLFDDKNIVKMLINAGAETSIHDYTFIGDIETVKAYLARDKNLINQKDIVGYTSLHIAALEGYKEIVNLLIENGADINLKDQSGNTPLMYAAMNSHNEVAKLLIDNNAALDIETKHGRTALFYAVEENNKEVQKYLIDKGAEINIDIAVSMGDIEITKSLIESDVDINKTISGYHTLLTLAVHHGQIEIAKMLIDNGIDINKGFAEMQYPIIQAIETNDEDMLEMLLKNGAAINMKSTTALHIASRMGLVNIAKILIDNGADVNAKNIGGATPLREACYFGYIDIINLLLDHGADIPSGESIYQILNKPVNDGNTEVIRLLLEKGENVFLHDGKKRESLIKRAMDYGYSDIVELLGGDSEQISKSKKRGPYSLIVTNPESVKKYLEFIEISYDEIWIPETKLIKEIEPSLSVTFPDNNYVGQKVVYTDAIPNNKIIRNYCKEYSGFKSKGKKYIICNMIEGLEKPLANKFHRLESYDRDIKCIIIDAKTLEIEKLIDEPKLLMPYY